MPHNNLTIESVLLVSVAYASSTPRQIGVNVCSTMGKFRKPAPNVAVIQSFRRRKLTSSQTTRTHRAEAQ